MKKGNCVRAVGFIDHGTGQHQSNVVYRPNKCIPPLTALQGGTQQIKVLRKYERHREDRIHEPLK